eukprot:m.177996 g.177996  ORF g.177996 m.177996 type:complete len:57 (-) comp14919_c0_seq3:328-498(-)
MPAVVLSFSATAHRRSNAPCAPRFSCLSVRPGLSIAALCVTFTRDADLRLRIQQAA